MIGLAQCNLGNDELAQLAFEQAAVIDKSANLFNAEYALKEGNRVRALQYILSIQHSAKGDEMAPFAAAVLNSEFGCKDVFNTTKIREVMDKYGNLKAADLAITLTAAAPTITQIPEETMTATATPIP
jgi:hypothetical protein